MLKRALPEILPMPVAKAKKTSPVVTLDQRTEKSRRKRPRIAAAAGITDADPSGREGERREKVNRRRADRPDHLRTRLHARRN